MNKIDKRDARTLQAKVIVRYYGPAAQHNVACPVYWDCGYSAVLDMNDGVFQPSWEAQRDGYVTLQIRHEWLRNWMKRLFPARTHAGWPLGENRGKGTAEKEYL